MAFAAGNKKGPKNEINVTPLVDVVLVLLIIFMVITPMLQRGKDVRLPKASKQEEEGKQADPLVVSVTTDKQIWLETTSVPVAELPDRLAKELAAQPTRKILLKGDEELTFGDVRTIMEVARKAGAKGVALGVQEQK